MSNATPLGVAFDINEAWSSIRLHVGRHFATADSAPDSRLVIAPSRPWMEPRTMRAGRSVNNLARRASGTQLVERFSQDSRGFLVSPTLFDVSQVSLVRRDLRGRRRIVFIHVRREPTARTIPLLRNDSISRESRSSFVAVSAEIRHRETRRSVAALGLTHRACPDSTTSNSATTSHE